MQILDLKAQNNLKTLRKVSKYKENINLFKITYYELKYKKFS